MFDNLEQGHRIKNKAFDTRALALRQQLLSAQFELAKCNYPVIIVVAGLDGAGKGSVVHRLNSWMDPRGIESHSFWKSSDEEQSRPYFWRMWRRLPQKGKIGIFFGSWYNTLLQREIAGDTDTGEFSAHCRNIQQLEKTLADDGALIIKLWFHISREMQYLQLSQDAPRKQQNLIVPANAKQARRDYKKILKAAEHLITQTQFKGNPWHLIEAQEQNYRDITAGEVILKAMNNHRESGITITSATYSDTKPLQRGALNSVDLSQTLDKGDYKSALRKYQGRLQQLAWEFHDRERSVVAVFEGWDAAGKGSTIRRVTGAFDPRLYKLVQFAAPTDEEKRQHYLWRFWRRLQRDGCNTFFDRSWYGRVLVERVEKFAQPHEWQRAYNEIRQFEQQLNDHGIVVLKFWLHISPDEQLIRFHEREKQAHKQYKITDEDWRNREKWPDYEVAVNEMLSQTSTSFAPWTVVAANDKRFARIQVLKTFCHAMEDALEDH